MSIASPKPSVLGDITNGASPANKHRSPSFRDHHTTKPTSPQKRAPRRSSANQSPSKKLASDNQQKQHLPPSTPPASSEADSLSSSSPSNVLRTTRRSPVGLVPYSSSSSVDETCLHTSSETEESQSSNDIDSDDSWESSSSASSSSHQNKGRRRRKTLPVIFFGTPSKAEHEKRAKYETRLRERRLLRRDSLDLARRRTMTTFELQSSVGGSNEPSSSVGPSSPTQNAPPVVHQVEKVVMEDAENDPVDHSGGYTKDEAAEPFSPSLKARPEDIPQMMEDLCLDAKATKQVDDADRRHDEPGKEPVSDQAVAAMQDGDEAQPTSTAEATTGAESVPANDEVAGEPTSVRKEKMQEQLPQSMSVLQSRATTSLADETFEDESRDITLEPLQADVSVLPGDNGADETVDGLASMLAGLKANDVKLEVGSKPATEPSKNDDENCSEAEPVVMETNAQAQEAEVLVEPPSDDVQDSETAREIPSTPRAEGQLKPAHTPSGLSDGSPGVALASEVMHPLSAHRQAFQDIMGSPNYSFSPSLMRDQGKVSPEKQQRRRSARLSAKFDSQSSPAKENINRVEGFMVSQSSPVKMSESLRSSHAALPASPTMQAALSNWAEAMIAAMSPVKAQRTPRSRSPTKHASISEPLAPINFNRSSPEVTTHAQEKSHVRVHSSPIRQAPTPQGNPVEEHVEDREIMVEQEAGGGAVESKEEPMPSSEPAPSEGNSSSSAHGKGKTERKPFMPTRPNLASRQLGAQKPLTSKAPMSTVRKTPPSSIPAPKSVGLSRLPAPSRVSKGPSAAAKPRPEAVTASRPPTDSKATVRPALGSSLAARSSSSLRSSSPTVPPAPSTPSSAMRPAGSVTTKASNARTAVSTARRVPMTSQATRAVSTASATQRAPAASAAQKRVTARPVATTKANPAAAKSASPVKTIIRAAGPAWRKANAAAAASNAPEEAPSATAGISKLAPAPIPTVIIRRAGPKERPASPLDKADNQSEAMPPQKDVISPPPPPMTNLPAAESSPMKRAPPKPAEADPTYQEMRASQGQAPVLSTLLHAETVRAPSLPIKPARALRVRQPSRSDSDPASGSQSLPAQMAAPRFGHAPPVPLSAAELARLTARNTRKNEVWVAQLDYREIKVEGAKPESPSAKIPRLGGAVKLSKADAANARANRAKKRNSDPESEPRQEEVQAEATPETHRLGKGESSIYESPIRGYKAKGVRWHKRLFVGPSDMYSAEHGLELGEREIPRGARPRKSLLLRKGDWNFDPHGNVAESEHPLSPRLKKTRIIIQQFKYSIETPEDDA